MNNHEMPSPARMGTALELKKRRDLALRATDALSEIFDADVAMRDLLAIAEREEDSPARLTARRALRAVAAIGKEDSEIARRLNKGDVYHYVEGVVNYGASTQRYLELMDVCGLNTEQATGIYALRELIAEYTDGTRLGFQFILNALAQVGISVSHAGVDPEHALAAFDDAGFLVDHMAYRTGDKVFVTQSFDQPKFRPTQGRNAYRMVEGDADGSITEGIQEGLREELRHPADEGDNVDENKLWCQETIATYLKNLGS